MSSFLCFICHSTVNSDTNEEMREKYREVVGMNLCPDSHLCHICCHVLNRLWLFRCVCLKRSLEYPVLFSEKGTLNLQRNDLEIHTVCFDDCDHYKNRNINSKYYHFTYFDGTFDCNEKYNVPNDYVELEEERQEFEEFLNNKIDYKTDKNMESIQNEAFLTDNTKFNECNKNSECFQDNYANVGLYEAEKNGNIQDFYREEYSEEIQEQYNEDDQTDNEETYTQDEDNDDQIHEHPSPVNPEIPIPELIDSADQEIPIPELIDSADQEIPQNKINKDIKEKKRFKKLLLSIEEQKAELEAKRKEKKYTEAEFKCYNCALGFLFKDTYQAHMMRHEESNGEYQCSICSLRFATVPVARSHTGLHAERHRCRRCSAVLRRRQRSDHARVCYNLQTDAASCHLCGRVFKDSNGLQQHLKRFHRSKDTGRTYSCNVCGAGFGDPAAVRAHMIKHIQRKFPCPRCASQFGSPYDLQKHFNKKHDAIGAARHAAKQLEYSAPRPPRACPPPGAPSRSHACGTCPASYSTRKSLLRHIRSHERREPAKTAVCHLCGATFKGNSKLNRHLRQVCEKNKLEEELSSYYAQETGV